MAENDVVAKVKSVLDGTSPTPLYEQIAQTISGAIERGELAPGALIPKEPDLARRLGVSRQTVNQALTTLARRGLLTRRRGVGTFVAEPFIEQPLDGLYSFIRTLTAQGHIPGARLLGRRVTLDDQASPLLTGRADGLIAELSRLRSIDGEPFVLETIYLPLGCADGISNERFVEEPLHDLLRECCDLPVTSVDETLRPVVLEPVDAALLGLPAGDPAFLVERVGYAGEQPVEVRRTLIRGDRYRYRVHLTGDRIS